MPGPPYSAIRRLPMSASVSSMPASRAPGAVSGGSQQRHTVRAASARPIGTSSRHRAQTPTRQAAQRLVAHARDEDAVDAAQAHAVLHAEALQALARVEQVAVRLRRHQERGRRVAAGHGDDLHRDAHGGSGARVQAARARVRQVGARTGGRDAASGGGGRLQLSGPCVTR